MPLAEQERAAIRDLAATGASCTTIAERLGLSVGAVAGSLGGGRKSKVDAAVIDRIRMLHEEGMGQRRIADTVGLSESTVARYLPGTLLSGMVPASGNGNGSTPAPAKEPDPVENSFVEVASEPAPPAPPPGPTPRPVALQSPPTAKQRAAWEAYHRLGSQGAAGRELGIHQGGVRTALLAYMRAMGIDGPIPPPANPPMVGSGADHASDIPAVVPAPVTAVPSPALVDLPSSDQACAEVAITSDPVGAYEAGRRDGLLIAIRELASPPHYTGALDLVARLARVALGDA